MSIRKSSPLRKTKGFSLIEVLIFVTILSLFLITSIAIITVSLRQNTLKIHMLKATHYNEQLMEWIRNEKEVDWNAFVLNAGNNIYCFESDTLSWTTGGITNIVNDKNECLTALGALYRRYTVFTTTVANGVPTQVNAVVHSEWEEAGGSYSTKLETLFTLWEK